MLVWLTLPFYDFCGFRSVAVNSVYKLQFFTFILVAPMHEFLMLARNKDTKKLMDAFSLYEDEQVFPKANVLRYVAKVLESAGEPVPFEVPQVCITYA